VAWKVNFQFDRFGGFVSEDPRPDIPQSRPLSRTPKLWREDDLSIGDFAYCFWGFGIWLVSAKALELLDQSGIVRLGTVEGLQVVQVVLQLDILDRRRSVPSGFGPDSFEGVHLIDSADEIAQRTIFRLPEPNSTDLFCGSLWKCAYEEAGLLGLAFERAVVGKSHVRDPQTNS
jgi:hypothetical protein